MTRFANSIMGALAVSAFMLVAAVCAFAMLGGPVPPIATLSVHHNLMPIALAGIIINKQNLQVLFTGIKTAFNAGFRTAKPMWDTVATLVPSTTKEEKYGWLGQFPRLREWIGDRQLKNITAHDYSIKNKKFESSVAIPRDDLDDDTYGVYTPLFQEMGYAAATHPDELVFALLAAGFTTTCYDGQFFFDTDHPVGDGEAAPASVSNVQAGAGAPWFLLDLNRPLKPIIFQKRREYDIKAMNQPDDEAVFMRDEYRYGVDARCNVGFGFWQQAFGSKATLDQTSFDSAYAAMMAFKSDEGRPLGVKPSHLVVGPSNRASALSVVQNERLANGESNKNYKAVDILIVPWLP